VDGSEVAPGQCPVTTFVMKDVEFPVSAVKDSFA
jgi:hypothetical protein